MSENFAKLKNFFVQNWKPIFVVGYVITVGILITRKVKPSIHNKSLKLKLIID